MTTANSAQCPNCFNEARADSPREIPILAGMSG